MTQRSLYADSSGFGDTSSRPLRSLEMLSLLSEAALWPFQGGWPAWANTEWDVMYGSGPDQASPLQGAPSSRVESSSRPQGKKADTPALTVTGAKGGM